MNETNICPGLSLVASRVDHLGTGSGGANARQVEEQAKAGRPTGRLRCIERKMKRRDTMAMDRPVGGGKYDGLRRCPRCGQTKRFGADWWPVVGGKLSADACLECYPSTIPGVRPIPTKSGTEIRSKSGHTKGAKK